MSDFHTIRHEMAPLKKRPSQTLLFEDAETPRPGRNSTNFVDNTKLPVHRWFRYSAGFSAEWASGVLAEHAAHRPTTVLDPFAGSGTTLLAADDAGVPSFGIEAHPFVARIAKAKMARRSDPTKYKKFANAVLKAAMARTGSDNQHSPLILKCFREEQLIDLDRLRGAWTSPRIVGAWRRV